MDRLTPLADAFLEAEDDDARASLAIGSLAVFTGPAPTFEQFAAAIAMRVPLIPRYRHKLRPAPFALAPPAWVDDPDFDVARHVGHAVLPAPGGRAEIGQWMSRVMTRRMDRSRPLWEYWLCEGLAGGRWAMLSKLHHSLADGVSATDLYRLMCDDGPDAPDPGAPVPWRPTPPRSAVAWTADAVWDAARAPVAGVLALGGALVRPGRLARRAVRTGRGLVELGGALRPVDGSSLTGRLSGVRSYTWTAVSLADVRAVRQAFGVTVNDVALAAATGGFRRLLVSRGEEPAAHALRSLVPVSTRGPGEESVPDNRVSLLLPYLPVDLPDPLERLLAVRERIRALRAAGEAAAGDAVTTAARYGLFAPVALGVRTLFRLPQQQISTVTTNVPGPRTTRWFLGHEVQEILPYVPIADRVRIGVAMFSYRDTLTFGVTADAVAVPDAGILADGITRSAAELVALAGASARGGSSSSRRQPVNRRGPRRR